MTIIRQVCGLHIMIDDGMVDCEPLAKSRAIPGRIAISIVPRLLWIGTDDAVLPLSVQTLDHDGRLLRRRTLLHPGAQLAEEMCRLTAAATKAVPQAGNLKVAQVVTNRRVLRLDCIVVLLAAARGDYVVDLNCQVNILVNR